MFPVNLTFLVGSTESKKVAKFLCRHDVGNVSAWKYKEGESLATAGLSKKIFVSDREFREIERVPSSVRPRE